MNQCLALSGNPTFLVNFVKETCLFGCRLFLPASTLSSRAAAAQKLYTFLKKTRKKGTPNDPTKEAVVDIVTVVTRAAPNHLPLFQQKVAQSSFSEFSETFFFFICTSFYQVRSHCKRVNKSPLFQAEINWEKRRNPLVTGLKSQERV